MSIETRRQQTLDKMYDEMGTYIKEEYMEDARTLLGEIVDMEILIEEDCNQ